MVGRNSRLGQDLTFRLAPNWRHSFLVASYPFGGHLRITVIDPIDFPSIHFADNLATPRV